MHTPGPWIVQSVASHGDTVAVVRDGLRSKIAVTHESWLCDEHGGTTAANARLIAKAPDLKAALAWALDQIEDDLDLDHQAALAGARKLLED